MWKKEKPDSRDGSCDDATDGAARDATSGTTDVAQSVNAFIGKGVEFKGVISYSGTVRIDGRMEGEIHTEGTLLIGEEAVLSAHVNAGTVICKGRITGDIQAKERVKLRAPAVLNGSVATPLLSVEEGVLFNGNCDMTRQGGRDQVDKGLHPVASSGGALKRSTA